LKPLLTLIKYAALFSLSLTFANKITRGTHREFTGSNHTAVFAIFIDDLQKQHHFSASTGYLFPVRLFCLLL
jgi:hypothetical protein